MKYFKNISRKNKGVEEQGSCNSVTAKGCSVAQMIKQVNQLAIIIGWLSWICVFIFISTIVNLTATCSCFHPNFHMKLSIEKYSTKAMNRWAFKGKKRRRVFLNYKGECVCFFWVGGAKTEDLLWHILWALTGWPILSTYMPLASFLWIINIIN